MASKDTRRGERKQEGRERDKSKFWQQIGRENEFWQQIGSDGRAAVKSSGQRSKRNDVSAYKPFAEWRAHCDLEWSKRVDKISDYQPLTHKSAQSMQHGVQEAGDYEPEMYRKLGFSGPANSQKSQYELRIWTSGSDQITHGLLPQVNGKIAECSVGSDLKTTFDDKGLPLLDKDFIEGGFKRGNYDLNLGTREIPYDRDACFQLALDAAAQAKPDCLEARSVVAMRGCLTSLIAALVNPLERPVLHVYRIGSTLMVSEGANDVSGEVPQYYTYRGHRFEALCTGKDLPSTGQCSHYFQVLDFALGPPQQHALVVAEVDAKDYRAPHKAVEVKLMAHPRYSKEHAFRFSLLRAWLQACFSSHKRFLVGLHNKHQVEQFMQSSSNAERVTLSDIEHELDVRTRGSLVKDRELWDPKVLFGWFGAVVKFLQDKTKPGRAYLFQRPEERAAVFTLAEKNELWVHCPDVFTSSLKTILHQDPDVFRTSLKAILREDRLLRLVSSYLRQPRLQHCDTSRPSAAEHAAQQADSETKYAGPPTDNPHIVLLDFSRHPQVFHDALRYCSALDECRVEASTELPPGPPIFVRPEMLDAARAAIAREGWSLQLRHVVVAQEFEKQVMEAIASVPSRAQVRLRSRTTAPAPASQSSGDAWENAHEDMEDLAAQQEDNEAGKVELTSQREEMKVHSQTHLFLESIVVKRTFIEMPVASSIYSGPSGKAKTKSTTDANPRVHFQPRKV